MESIIPFIHVFWNLAKSMNALLKFNFSLPDRNVKAKLFDTLGEVLFIKDIWCPSI